jgi:branched-chain amino acid aminotransferase
MPLSEVQIAITSAAARYGLVVFDGLAAFVTPAARPAALLLGLERHLARFERSSRELGLSLSPSRDELRQAVHQVLTLNRPESTCAVRLFAYSDAGRFDAQDEATVSVFLLSLSGYAPARPLRLALSTQIRSADGDLPRHIKATSHYVMARRAVLEARRAGFDDVIFRNERGNVTESSRASFLLVHGSRILSAPASDGVLPGITREILRTLVGLELGCAWEERSLTDDDLRAADGAVLCSSSLGVAAVGEIDGRAYGRCRVVDELIAGYGRASRGEVAGLADLTERVELSPP